MSEGEGDQVSPEAIIQEWERLEGESMREGHRATLERLIGAALHSRDERTLQEDVERLGTALADAESRNRRSICSYCGHLEDHESLEVRIEQMTEHILACEKHPLREVPALILRAEAAESALSAARAEQEAVLDDLGMLLEALGGLNVARPISPHAVMLECIAEVQRLRADLERLKSVEQTIRVWLDEHTRICGHGAVHVTCGDCTRPGYRE
jgi:hypothetical protein